MDDSLQYFGSEDIFTLIVGQERKKLYASRPVLQQIPFFDNALKGNHFKEAKNKTFELPEDQPKAVADLLYFVFANHVRAVDCEEQGVGRDKEKIVEEYLKAFIVADKFMAERTANRLLDRISCHFRYNNVENDHIDILSSAGLQATKLYNFLINDLASTMKHAIRQGKRFRESDKHFATDSESFLANMASDTLTAVLRSLLDPKADLKSSTSKWDSPFEDCSLHTHHFTKRCPQENWSIDAGW